MTHPRKSRSARQSEIEKALGLATLTRRKSDALTRARKDAQTLMGFAQRESLDIEALASAIKRQAPTAEVLVFLVALASKAGAANAQSRAAASKNAKPRSLVREQWEKRPDSNESKAAFCRRMSELVIEKFDCRVKPEWMAKKWLAGLDAFSPDRHVQDAIAWTGRFHSYTKSPKP